MTSILLLGFLPHKHCITTYLSVHDQRLPSGFAVIYDDALQGSNYNAKFLNRIRETTKMYSVIALHNRSKKMALWTGTRYHQSLVALCLAGVSLFTDASYFAKGTEIIRTTSALGAICTINKTVEATKETALFHILIYRYVNVVRRIRDFN